jgi:hypothetical protein
VRSQPGKSDTERRDAAYSRKTSHLTDQIPKSFAGGFCKRIGYLRIPQGCMMATRKNINLIDYFIIDNE